PFLDREIANRLATHISETLAIDLRLGVTISSTEASETSVRCTLSDGSVVEAERLLVAAGRTGNTAGLDVETLGLEPDKRGLLKVDENYRTEALHVYAVGDVIGFPALASVAMEQARVAAVHAFGISVRERVSPMLPYGIYTIPEVSSIGESEESAREKGIDFEIGRASYAAYARGQLIGVKTVLLNLVC